MPIAGRKVAALLLFAALCGPVCAGTNANVDRSKEAAVIPGGLLAELHGTPIDELGLYAVDAEGTSFVPVPFQIDEMVDHVFNPGTPLEFTQRIHDVFDEADGTFDEKDELAFLYGDASIKAPSELAWPAGARGIRIEIGIEDDRPVGPGIRWVYLFSGSDLERSPESYVDAPSGPVGTVRTAGYEVRYEGKWLLTQMRVVSPCGSALDLLDRIKGRAKPLLENEEDEEGWNSNSVFLGVVSGPVRSIRYVRGAMSGVNTIHHDIFTPFSVTRLFDLRVHPLLEVRFYMDLLPSPSARIWYPEAESSIAVDGSPDANVGGGALPEWIVYGSDDGGLVTLYDVPSSDRYAGPTFLYIDDAAVDDAIATNPDYGDDDDAAFGVHGFVLEDVGESNIEAHPMEVRWFPVCRGESGGELGEAFQEIEQTPLVPQVEPQFPSLEAIRSLAVAVDGPDILLSWDAVQGATGYRVYATGDPSRPLEEWFVLGEPTTPSFRDANVVGDPRRFYVVLPFNEGGEGPR
jgi:hypothetical protein